MPRVIARHHDSALRHVAVDVLPIGDVFRRDFSWTWRATELWREIHHYEWRDQALWRQCRCRPALAHSERWGFNQRSVPVRSQVDYVFELRAGVRIRAVRREEKQCYREHQSNDEC